jgi:hypothetical protein
MKRVGQYDNFSGDVTTLNWITPRAPAALEINLGFGAHRLAAGYWVVLLVSKLEPDDFEFSGTTLRSGGRLGLPAGSGAADKLRPRVHDQVLFERGPLGYKAFQEQVLKDVMISGPRRIAKVIPETPHDLNAAPNVQYPKGGGGLQWTIKKIKPKKFLIALHVAPNGMATARDFSVSLAEPQPNGHLIDNRVRISHYLATAS